MFNRPSSFSSMDLSSSLPSASPFFVCMTVVLATFLLHQTSKLFVRSTNKNRNDNTIEPDKKSPKQKGKTKAIRIFDDGGTSPCVDIVAVHGLASNPETTWNYKDVDGNLAEKPPQWLRDFLPKEDLNARIMSFNYNSEWKGHALSKSLEDHGDDLLLALADKRQTQEEQNRGIIFIGHSFGGIVIKQAVFNTRMHGDRDTFRQNITSKAKGFVFLGTPHHGSGFTTFGKLISAFSFWKGSSNTLLQAIEPGSTSNELLHKTFLKTYNMEEMVVCFFEAIRISFWGIPLVNVVSKESARIEQADCFGFEANHQNLQRFGSQDDPDYRKLVTVIRRFTTQGKLVSSTVQPYSVGPSTFEAASTASTLYESIEFPVDTLTLAHNTNFVGRNDEFVKMFLYMLKDRTLPGPISCLVHGTGGHGKTQFVHEYAYRNKKYYDAIFWVEAETDIVLLRSFGAIGRELDLFKDETIGQVEKEMILKWLKATHRTWLLVFDNVVNPANIRSYWPSSSKAASSIIATSQFSLSTSWSTQYSMELGPLDDDKGSQLLLNQVLEPGIIPDDDTEKQAREISSLLGGSPLWLGQASALIKNTYTLREYIDYLKTSSNALEEEDIPQDWNYGKPALATFDQSLDKLSNESRDLIFMIAFMNPERIEEKLLLTDAKSERLKAICSSKGNNFLRMVRRLHMRNLVSRQIVEKVVNGVTEELAFLTTHRSLQEGLLYKMNKSPEIRQVAFDRVIDLLSEHCPPPLKTLQPVEAHWKMILTLLPHLLTLLRGFNRSEPRIEGSERFARLLVNMGGMSLYDHGFTSQVQIILTKAKQILDEIGVEEDAPIRGDIGTVLGLNTDNLGISQRAEGLRVRRETLEIRLKHHKKLSTEEINEDDEILLFNADTDLVCSLQHLNLFDEVRVIINRCLEQYKKWGDEKKVPYEYAKYYNHMAYVLLYDGEPEEAVRYAERGSDLMALAQPNSQMAVTFKFDWATILFQAGNTQQAIEEHHKLLQDRINGCGGLDILTLVSRVHLGIMYFLVEDFENAKTWLRDSLVLAEKIDAPKEHLARTKYYLSLVDLRADPQSKDALKMHQEAKQLLFQLLELDGSGSMREYVLAEDYHMLFDYIVSWESRLTTPRRKSSRGIK